MMDCFVKNYGGIYKNSVFIIWLMSQQEGQLYQLLNLIFITSLFVNILINQIKQKYTPLKASLCDSPHTSNVAVRNQKITYTFTTRTLVIYL